jgi:hypothetical protein
MVGNSTGGTRTQPPKVWSRLKPERRRAPGFQEKYETLYLTLDIRILMRGGTVSSLLCIVAAKISVNVCAVAQTTLSFGILKVGKYVRRIPKAALAYKRAPDLDILV